LRTNYSYPPAYEYKWNAGRLWFAAAQSRNIFMETLGPQFARRAFSAAVAPVVQFVAFAQVAGVRAGADQLDQRIAAEILRQLPGLRFVEPHQRGFQFYVGCHAEL